MAYRTEKNQNGNNDIVIDGWESGIAASPYLGISDIRNVNIRWLPKAAYVNYARNLTSTANATGTFTANSSSVTNPPAELFTTPLFSNANLKLYWRMEGNANDATANGNNGGPSGVTFNTGNGKFNEGAGFNGSNSAITFQYLLTNVDFSIHFWVKTTATSGPIVSWRNGLGETNSIIRAESSGSNILFRMRNNSGTGQTITSTATINDGVYHMIDFTYKASTGTMILYVDDVLSGTPTGSITGTINSNGSFIAMGEDVVDSAFWSGDVDDFAVFNAVLTKAQIDELWFVTIVTTSPTITSTISVNPGDVVQFTTTGTLPTPLVTPIDGSNNNFYQVISTVPGVSFTVAPLSNNSVSPYLGGSSPTAMSTNGTGVQTVTTVTMGVAVQGVKDNTTLVPNYTSAVTYYIYDSFGLVWSNVVGVAAGTNEHYFFPIAYTTFGIYPRGIGNITNGVQRGCVFYCGLLFLIREDGSIYYYIPNGSSSTINLWSGKSVTGFVPHMATTSRHNTLAYICSGNTLDSIGCSSPTSTSIGDYSLSTSILNLPANEVVSWIEDLGSSIIISGINVIYVWDATSADPLAAGYVNEKISKIINIANVVYIFAGNKGNIYSFSGYAISFFTKIPDHITGVTDPSWTIGGISGYRSKLYFGACCTVPNGSNVVGVFSLDISTGSYAGSVVSGSLTFESQSSFGTTVATSGVDNIWLILNDMNYVSYNQNTASVQTYDFYYTCWYSAATNALGYSGIGGVDDNNQTPYSGSQAYIITDLIPVGTILQKKTFAQVEFKLDYPLQFSSPNGESISIAYRETLDQNFTTIGTTTATATSNPFSDNYTVNFEKGQWAQFKITLNGLPSTTGNSYVRLREMRLIPSQT